jgi:hypothetical protein
MNRFLRHIAVYGLITFIVLNAIAWCSLYSLRNASFYKPQFITYELKENQFDYAIIGSSIGLTTLNTVLIDSITQKKGINLSIDDTSISSNYLMLQHFFEQGKKINVCVLAINHWDLANSSPQLNDNDYRFLPFVANDYVYDYYSEMERGWFKPLTLSHYIPAIGVSYYNTEIFYPSIIAPIHPNKKNRFDAQGNYFYPEKGIVEPKEENSVTLAWKNPFIKRIKQLCDAHNTKLIVYQAPMYKTKIYNTNSEYTFINHAASLTDSTYFYDEIHLNASGRVVASTLFANEMKELIKF